MMYGWAPMEGAPLWEFKGTAAWRFWTLLLVNVVFGVMWLLTATFVLDHFSLFGITQGTGFDMMKAIGFGMQDGFSDRGHYKLVRHPIMTGFFVMFWVAPSMSITHLLFSILMSVYILVAVFCFEEPDLHKMFGEGVYEAYAKKTPSLCPLLKVFYLDKGDV